jgi:plastocyanin
MTSHVRISAAYTALLVLGLTAACGDGATDPGDGDPVATTSVSVRDNFFQPPNIVVAPGATVTWTWQGSQVHNVTWVGSPLPDSPDQVTGIFEAAMPSQAGTHAYYCTFHGTPTSGMRGTVRVE